MRERIGSAIAGAAEFLASRQLHSGEIDVLRSIDPDMREARRYPTVFGSAIAVLSLQHSAHIVLQPLVARAGRFLVEQRRGDGTWSYWLKPEESASDADDSACCSLALLRSGHLPAGEIHRNIPIFEAYRTTSGLFQTWFHEWTNDVDGVVNANVVGYLGERSSTEAAIEFVAGLIRDGPDAGAIPYYVDRAALYYATARALHRAPRLRECEGALMELLRNRAVRPAGTVLPIAQSLAALALCGCSLLPEFSPTIDWLLGKQNRNGSWPLEAWYTGPDPSGAPSGLYGSEELSTVLCLESLLRAT